MITEKVFFAEATEQVSLDSPKGDTIVSSVVTSAIPPTPIAPRIESKSLSAPVIFDMSKKRLKKRQMEIFLI